MGDQPNETPVHILLVEDNPGDQDLATMVLRDSARPMTVHVAEDGVEAMRYLERKGQYANAPRPDLVLLDLNLPRKDGRQVLEEMKSNPVLRTIPVVILTTSVASDDVARCYGLHANCYVRKPVSLEEYIEKMHAIQTFWFGTVTRDSTT
jgi:chemotaxis family two-component system response regulator Rcp1